MLFASLLLLIVTGMYIFVRPFRREFNGLVEGILIWLFGQVQNMPGWARAIMGWLNRTGSNILAGIVWATVRLLWLLGVLTVIYFYAVSHAQETGNNVVLLIVMLIIALLLLIFIQASSTVSGMVSRFLNTTREFTRTLTTIFMIYSLHLAMLLMWSDLYLAYMWYIIIFTLIVTGFFHVLSIHNNRLGTWTGRVLVLIFVLINVSPLISPELKTLVTKRAVSTQKEETGRSGFEMEEKLAETRIPLKIKMDANFILLDGTIDTTRSVTKDEIVQVVNGDTITSTDVPVRFIEKYVGSKLVMKGYLPFWVIDFDSSPDEWANPSPPPPEIKPEVTDKKTVYKEYQPSPWLILEGFQVGTRYTSIYDKWSKDKYRPRPGQLVYIYPYVKGLMAKVGSGKVRVTPQNDESGTLYGCLEITANVRGKPLLLKTGLQSAWIDSIHVYQ